MTTLQLYVDLAPGILDLVAQADQAVVESDTPQGNANDERYDNPADYFHDQTPWKKVRSEQLKVKRKEPNDNATAFIFHFSPITFTDSLSNSHFSPFTSNFLPATF
jgi:hypothetical protein